MGWDLYQTEQTFREHMDKGARLLQSQLGFDFREVLFAKEGETKSDLRRMLKRDSSPADETQRRLDQTSFIQPVTFLIEYALAQLWIEWGVQPQAMIQTFLNIHVFGMDVQSAVEAPRFATYSFPASSAPHAYYPARVNLEKRIDPKTGEGLAALGHDVQWWPDWTWLAGAVCTVVADEQSGVLKGGADPRRPSYALGL